MDNGAIIIQAALSADFREENFAGTKEKLHALEHKIFVQALKWLSEERIEIVGRKTVLKENNKKKILIDGALISPALEEN